MDHKVSKDMISSGMIPSGEKTQADLGRTQYGSVPSPSSLMDAYKSMYEKKEEVINEMASFKKLSGRQKRIQKTPRGGSSGSGVYDATTGGKHDSQTPGATGSVSGPGQGKPMVGKVTVRKVDPQTLKKNPRGDIQTNSFDLLAAYHAVYEHHKKDADGNTIPHEGEEINEALPLLAAPLIAKGLMAAKGAMAAAKAAKLGAVAAKGIGAFKKGLMTSKAVGAAGKITTSGGKLAAGAKKVGMAQKAGQVTRSAGAAMKNNPMTTYIGADAVGSTASAIRGKNSVPQPAAVQQRTSGRRTAGMYNDVDLFDIVKGQLLDEGLTEKEVLDVMTTLTIDEINEVINVEESLAKLALKTGAVVAGGVLAKKGLDKAKQSVDNQINKARDKGIGGNTRPGADKMYFGK